MHISRGVDGALELKTFFDPLPTISGAWHPQNVDILSLKKTKWYRSGVHEVLYQGRLAIMKHACFDWDLPRLENETWAYSIITRHHDQNPEAPPIAPKVLGHLTENGRIIGLLLEKVEGRHASIGDLPKCKKVLHKLHSMGLVHGDINRYNFIVDQTSDRVVMVDFEHAEESEEGNAQREIASLES